MLPWESLLRCPEEQLATIDIAAVNLACAAGLPGTEGWDVPACLRRLAEWSERVASYTDKKLPLYQENPEKFNNSEAYFRALALITVLQRDCGVRYHPEKTAENAPFTVEDSFIHGVVFGKGGTCASLPVVYAAVGRRLGYPIKLVSAKGKDATHLFCRWDNGKERFNIEASGPGLSCFEDNFYRKGRYALSRDLEGKGCFLRSKTPREELAGFLAERSICWKDLRNYRWAAEAMAWAAALAPANALLPGHAEDHAQRMVAASPARQAGGISGTAD